MEKILVISKVSIGLLILHMWITLAAAAADDEIANANNSTGIQRERVDSWEKRFFEEDGQTQRQTIEGIPRTCAGTNSFVF